VNIENRNSEELCRYRLHQAEDTITEAMLLQNSGHYRGAVNRACYAMFYAIQVLIVQNKVKVSKHSATISYFDRHFVKTGIFDKNFSKWFHRLFDLRQDADYGDLFEPTPTQCNEAIEQAKEFVFQIKAYFETQAE
jgi:uncharacterized protein (UPF0332 family)